MREGRGETSEYKYVLPSSLFLGGGEGPTLRSADPVFSAGLITGIMLPSTFGLLQSCQVYY